jgi:ankyrin repeat protein
VEVVRLLLEYGAQIEGSGAAQAAAAKGHIDVLDVLLQHGADLNTHFRNTGTRFKDYDGSAKEVATNCELGDVVL